MAFDDRISELEQAVSAEPHRRALRLELAEALLHAGRYHDCIGHVRLVVAVTPGDAQALGIGAMAADLSGDPAAANAYAAMLRVSTKLPESTNMPESRPDYVQTDPDVFLTIPLVNLCDVDGYTEEKRRLEHVVLTPVRHRRNLPAGMKVPSGLLLYGPAGSAKSHLAHALAGELHLNLVKVNVADAIDPWGAALPGAIRSAFALAAQHAPAMVFLEDVEAVAHRRLRFTPRGREALDELLEVLDSNDPTKVLVVGSTSAPWQVNPLLRRAGRFEKSMLVGPPDLEARKATLERHVKTRVLPVDADMYSLAARTEGCTTDDLIRLCSMAAEHALRDCVDRNALGPITQSHFVTALGGMARSAYAWFDVAYNAAEFTDDSDEYDPLFDYIRRNVRRL
jgi:SpoVK/Ycf46/Vps4 family AAA+-type ATPase